MKTILFMLFFCIVTIRQDPEAFTTIDRTITGKVIDENGDPLIGASIMTKDFGTGTVTDFDGKFSLLVNDTCNFLVVSYTGYTTQQISIKGKDSILVTLLEGFMLEEVQVIGAGIIREKHCMSYAVTSTRRGHKQSKTHVNDQSVINSGSISHGAPLVQYEDINDYNTEDYDVIVENSFQRPEDNPLSTFSIDVDRASYANVRRYISNGQVPPKDAVRIEEMVNYFDYDYDNPTGETPFTIFTEVGACPWEPKNKLVHIGLQGKKIPTENLPASNLVFLVDVSGSMNEPNKLPLVVSSFKILVEQLRQQDRVAIVVYAGSSGLVLPSTSGANKSEIIEVLDRLRAGGSTAGAQGIRQAYDVARENFIPGGNNRVVLATDGDFNVGVSSDAELVEIIEKERESGVFLSVLGYGTGNYQDAKMQKLADHGNGNHGYVDNIEEARKVFVHEFGGTMFTIAKDVKIQIEFNPQHVAGYRLIGYENRLLNKEDFNDDKKDAGEMGSGHTVTALYEIIPVDVESDFLKSVDKLKYQKSKTVASANKSDEILHLKCRYKLPDDSTSKLLETSVLTNDRSFDSCSANLRWSATVASFGMLLRDSKYKGKVTFSDVENWAANAKGTDPNRYRKDFLELVRKIGPVMEASAQK